MKPFYGGKIMKNLIIVAIAAISVAASAQTSTTATNMNAEAAVTPATVNAAAPATTTKKTTAKKAVKSANKTATKVAPAAAVTTTTTTIIEQKSSAAPAGEKAVTPADAAGTSTTSLNDAASAKKLNGSVSVTPSQDASDVGSVQVLSKVGASYKVAPKLNLKIAQTFETLNAGASMDQEKRELISRSNFRSAWTDLSASTSTSGILGSNDIAMSLNIKKLTGDAVITQVGAFSKVDAMIDLNASIPYTLNPKFDLSIDTQIRHYIKDVAAESSYRLLAVPTLSYNLNDKVSFYQGAGLIMSIKDNTELRRSAERLSLSTGVGYAATKSLSFDLNVSQDKAIYVHPTTKADVTAFQLYNATAANDSSRTFDSVAYEATVAYSF